VNYDIGYQIVSDEVVDEHGTLDDQCSIVEFLRLVRGSERIPLNVTVWGLDDLLMTADDSESVSDLLHEVLADGVNHLHREQPVVQFVVEDLEYWDEPVVVNGDKRYKLGEIFTGGLVQEGADWYSCPLNVTS
jgi:hypothetical protein